jgi:hypothetical protein
MRKQVFVVGKRRWILAAVMLLSCLLLSESRAFVVPLSVSAEEMEQASITDVTAYLIKEGSNHANLLFMNCANTEEEPFVSLLLEKYALFSANLFVSAPTGTTNSLTGMKNQLPGSDTGAILNIPLDVRRPEKALIGVNHISTFTPDKLGEDTFNAMIAHLRNLYNDYLKNGNTSPLEQFYQEGEENPVFYLTYTPDVFLDKFGISIMSDYTGTVTDISKFFQFGISYNEERFVSGNIDIVYGVMLVDSAPVDGKSGIDMTGVIYPDSFYQWLFVYDWASDNTLKFSYWFAKKDEGNHSSSGCNIGVVGLFALTLAPMAGILGKLKGKIIN